MDDVTDEMRLTGELGNQISLLLHGHPPAVQGAVLATLTAMFLAGHIIEGSKSKTDAVRDEVLEVHIRTVRRMIPIVERDILGGRTGHGDG